MTKKGDVSLDFLRLIYRESFRPLNGGQVGLRRPLSRTEVNQLFRDNYKGAEFGEILDKLFSDGFLDAEDRRSSPFQDYFVTAKGVVCLNGEVDPNEFELGLGGSFPSAPIPVDSSSWTGRRLRSGELEELARAIDDALIKIDGLQLPQARLAQARSFLLAARSLAEAPDPPVNVISWLLANFDRVIGVSSLLVGVASLVSSWTG